MNLLSLDIRGYLTVTLSIISCGIIFSDKVSYFKNCSLLLRD
jgi:hypothetical protein